MATADQFLTGCWRRAANGMAALNARRLGVMYVIWNGKIWGAYRSADGWRPYTGGESHSDHIHISLSWNGAMKSTSWWTGKAAPTRLRPLPRRGRRDRTGLDRPAARRRARPRSTR